MNGQSCTEPRSPSSGQARTSQAARTFGYDIYVSVEVTPNIQGEPVEKWAIVFSEPISGFGLADLTLTRTADTSTELLPGAATLTSADNVTWVLGNIGPLTEASGIYELTLTADGSGIRDEAGSPPARQAHGLTAPVIPARTVVSTNWT